MKAHVIAFTTVMLLAGGAIAADQATPGGMMQGQMRMQGMAMMPPEQMAERLGSSGDIDADFAQMMVPHHEQAMDPELKTMAEKMLKDQQAEVSQLQDWSKSHGKGRMQ